jgi:hypothetical protein
MMPNEKHEPSEETTTSERVTEEPPPVFAAGSTHAGATAMFPPGTVDLTTAASGTISTTPATTDVKPFAEWAKVHKTADWLVKCASVGEVWPEGQEMTEVKYLAAINRAASVTAR